MPDANGLIVGLLNEGLITQDTADQVQAQSLLSDALKRAGVPEVKLGGSVDVSKVLVSGVTAEALDKLFTYVNSNTLETIAYAAVKALADRADQ